jgi:hypothetical protein
MHGFQLWVNLPRRDKMMHPRHQEIPREKIPIAVSTDKRITVRVFVGEAMGAKAVIDTRTLSIGQRAFVSLCYARAFVATIRCFQKQIASLDKQLATAFIQQTPAAQHNRAERAPRPDSMSLQPRLCLHACLSSAHLDRKKITTPIEVARSIVTPARSKTIAQCGTVATRSAACSS